MLWAVQHGRRRPHRQPLKNKAEAVRLEEMVTMTDTQAWILIIEVGVLALAALRSLIGR